MPQASAITYSVVSSVCLCLQIVNTGHVKLPVQLLTILTLKAVQVALQSSLAWSVLNILMSGHSVSVSWTDAIPGCRLFSLCCCPKCISTCSQSSSLLHYMFVSMSRLSKASKWDITYVLVLSAFGLSAFCLLPGKSWICSDVQSLAVFLDVSTQGFTQWHHVCKILQHIRVVHVCVCVCVCVCVQMCCLQKSIVYWTSTELLIKANLNCWMLVQWRQYISASMAHKKTVH